MTPFEIIGEQMNALYKAGYEMTKNKATKPIPIYDLNKEAENEIKSEALQRWEAPYPGGWFNAYCFLKKMGWSEEKIEAWKDSYLQE